MKKNRMSVLMAAALLMISLAACGVPEEKLTEAKTSLEQMQQARDAAESVYLDITDSTKRGELDSLLTKAQEAEAAELSKMNVTQVDTYIATVKDITTRYQNLSQEFALILEEETLEKEERTHHHYIDVYVVNKTGITLSEIKLQDLTAEKYSDNLIGDDMLFENNYSLMGVRLDIDERSTDWVFVVADEAGTEYNLVSDSLHDKSLDGASIVLKMGADPSEYTATVSK